MEQITKEEDIIVASEFEATKTKLEYEICRHCEESRVSVESSRAVNDWQFR